MQYALDKISTLQVCDDLLAKAQQKKRALQRKRRNLGESIDAFRKRMDRIEKELTDVRSSLAALTIAHHAMPEGKDKATVHIMVKRLELRQATLEKMAYTCNVASLLVKEMRYNVLDGQVLVMEDYIDILERTRTALSEPALFVNRAGDFSRPPLAQQSLQHTLASRWMPSPAIPPDTFSDHEAQSQSPSTQTAGPRRRYERVA